MDPVPRVVEEIRPDLHAMDRTEADVDHLGPADCGGVDGEEEQQVQFATENGGHGRDLQWEFEHSYAAVWEGVECEEENVAPGVES